MIKHNKKTPTPKESPSTSDRFGIKSCGNLLSPRGKANKITFFILMTIYALLAFIPTELTAYLPLSIKEIASAPIPYLFLMLSIKRSHDIGNKTISTTSLLIAAYILAFWLNIFGPSLIALFYFANLISLLVYFCLKYRFGIIYGEQSIIFISTFIASTIITCKPLDQLVGITTPFEWGTAWVFTWVVLKRLLVLTVTPSSSANA